MNKIKFDFLGTGWVQRDTRTAPKNSFRDRTKREIAAIVSCPTSARVTLSRKAQNKNKANDTK